MNITLHAKEIRVSVEEGSINHLILQNFVARYFTAVVRLADSLMIMHKETEIPQKRYLFQWLYAAYKKQRTNLSPAFLKMLQSAISFPINIKVRGTSKPVASIEVHLSVMNDKFFALTIEPASSLALHYFHRRFFDQLERKISNNKFQIQINQQSLTILSELLERTQILAQPVFYYYEKTAIEKLIAKNNYEKEQFAQKQRYYRLIINEDDRINNAYRLLGLDKNADIDSVKKNYRLLAFRYHPDRSFGKGAEAQRAMTEQFRAVSDAYALISKTGRI